MGQTMGWCCGARDAPLVNMETFNDKGNEVERCFGEWFALYDSLCKLQARIDTAPRTELSAHHASNLT
jgi:hypothetical protein